jgi:hypothetical protein
MITGVSSAAGAGLTTRGAQLSPRWQAAMLSLPQNSAEAFLGDCAEKLRLRGFVCVEEVVPHGRRACVVDDFQRPLRILEPVDLDIDGDAALGEAAAQRRGDDRWIGHRLSSGLRRTPRRSAFGPQVLEAKCDQLPDHGGAAGFVEAGIARGVDFFDHWQGKADLDDFQTLVGGYRRTAAPARGRSFWCL